MTLADRLAQPPIDQPVRTRYSAPRGWEPGIRFDPDTQLPTEITTPAVPKVEGDDWASVLESMDYALPAGYELRLVSASYDPFAWTRDSKDQKYATTKPAWRYRFAVVPSASVHHDVFEILGRLKRTPKPRTKYTGEASFVVNLNDWQTGKDAGGGTDALIERLDGYFDLVRDRASELGKSNLGELVVLGGGDMVEGCFIYPHQAFQIDRDRRAQSNTTTTMIVDFLDRLAPAFDRARVLAVPGNHGEHRVDGKRINRGDNDDLKVFEDAAREISRDSKLQHVAFLIAQEQAALTIDVQGHILALTHGSVYGKGTGSSPDVKAYNWFRNQAAGHRPVGDATILVGNHFHHEIVKNWGSLLFIQNPAADGGSPEFADYSGTDAAPGMTTWVMNTDTKFRDYHVIR